MYKVLIVDDEIYVVKSLTATINWNEYGYEVIGHAENGIDALRLIEELKPDLVFADIKMPGMSGLELIKTVNENMRQLIFVVISGYAEFAYAQKAMNFGALGFCLKPFDDREIINVLQKARSILDKNKASLEMRLLDIMEDEESYNDPEAQNIFKLLDFEYGNENNVLVLVSIGTGKLNLPLNIRYIHLELGSRKNAYILPFDKEDFIYEQLSGSLPENIKGIGLCKACCTFKSIKRGIEESIISANQYFITGKKGVYESVSGNNEELNRTIHLLEKAVEAKESLSILKELDMAREIFMKGACDIRFALRIYNMFMSFLYRLDTVKYEDYVYSYDQLTHLFGDAGQMLASLKDLMTRQANGGNEPISEDVRNETFKKILQYVNTNYFSDISIQSISYKFTINPSYVSQLFKKELGMTFTDYVTRMRISYACNLLKITDLPVYEIAKKAGYEEYYYFTRVFKRIMGKTPTELRSGKE
jgi:Response regulator containing CheY-like receiver domain and AraC-type DNA-binding domain